MLGDRIENLTLGEITKNLGRKVRNDAGKEEAIANLVADEKLANEKHAADQQLAKEKRDEKHKNLKIRLAALREREEMEQEEKSAVATPTDHET
jgi:hypothetical protein